MQAELQIQQILIVPERPSENGTEYLYHQNNCLSICAHQSPDFNNQIDTSSPHIYVRQNLERLFLFIPSLLMQELLLRACYKPYYVKYYGSMLVMQSCERQT